MGAGPLVEFAGLAARPRLEWGAYRRWNSAICEYFFSGRFADMPVYLDIDEETLRTVHKAPAGHERRRIDSLVAAVKQTMNWSYGNPFHPHLQLSSAWSRSQSSTYPPFVALLGLFSTVAEAMVATEDFAPNNYYGRLLRQLDLDDETFDALVRGYREATAQLWPALNRWLMMWDGALGRPTARALDHRKYVSTAISQALVRDHDRLILRRMFNELGFEPHQSIQPIEMHSVLLHWVRQGHEATSLGRLLKKGKDIFERVVEIACAELEGWDGRVATSTSRLPVETRLRVVAQLRSHPLPNLDLYLTTTNDASIASTSYGLASYADNVARAAFAMVDGDLRLDPLDTLDVLSLEPWSKISAGDILLARVDLVPRTLGRPQLVRSGQPICVMSLRETVAAYREVAQASLMEHLLILAHDSVAPKVNNFLEKCARPGFKTKTPAALRGLPAHWTAFLDVQIVQRVQEPGLESLAPLSDRRLLLSGGLSLGRDTWHREVAPEVLIADSTPGSFDVVLQGVSQSGEQIDEINLGSFESAAVFSLDKHLPDATYSVLVRSSGGLHARISHRAEFRLVSSDHPRPWIVAEHEAIAHFVSMERAWGLVSAVRVSEIDANEQVAFIQGARVIRGLPTDVQAPAVALPTSLKNRFVAAAEDSVRSTLTTTQTATAGSCIQRGYHHYCLEPVPPGAQRGLLVRGSCTECHVDIWMRTGGTKKRRSSTFNRMTSRSGEAQQPENRIANSLPNVKGAAGTQTSVFDALNYLRSGSFAQFASLIAAVDEQPWAAHELLRELCALGTVDVERDRATLRPVRWQMCRTSLVGITADCGVLLGWRSRKLLSQLQLAVQRRGGTLEQSHTAKGIPLVFVQQIAVAEYPDVCIELMDQEDAEIEDIASGHERLLSVLPPLSVLSKALPVVRLPSSDLQQFDFSDFRWKSVSCARGPGAYRTEWRGMSYFYLSSESSKSLHARLADARTAKHLAARELGYSLIAYDESAKQLVVPLGCEPPGLLERALVLCSGRPPDVAQGMVRYGGVEPTTAGHFWNRLIA